MTTKTITTLCIAQQGNTVLLGMKKRGFGKGRWNGFGGKLRAGETIYECALRETQEECDIIITSMELAGILTFTYLDKNKTVEVNIYKVNEFVGIPGESEEMAPRFFNIDQLPYGEMWPDDQYWLPLFFACKKFTGHFTFKGYDRILKYSLKEIPQLQPAII